MATESEVEGPPSENLPVPQAPSALTSATAVEQTRAIQEVQSRLIIAKRFPRDEIAAHARIMKACKRRALADQAVYRLPIGNKTQVGPSIRLAEVLANAWGNISFGVKEIARASGRSQCIAYCWDQETNTLIEYEFEVEHWIEVGQKGNKSKRPITDPVEIDRLIANRGARKMRNAILQVIPGDVIDEAVKACRKTVAEGGGVPLTDRIRTMVTSFAEISVTQEMLEQRLGYPIADATGDDIASLQGVWKALVDKEAKRSEFFKTEDVERQSSSLNDKLAKAAEGDRDEAQRGVGEG